MKYIKTFEQFINESKVNEAAHQLKYQYEQLIKKLEKAKVPCKVTLSDNTIIVECGWNYPDRIADKVFDAAEEVKIKSNDLEVCAESSGHYTVESKRLNGGPKRY